MEHWAVLSQIWLWITYDASARHNWDEAKGSHKISIRGTEVKVKAWIKVKGTKAKWDSENKS